MSWEGVLKFRNKAHFSVVRDLELFLNEYDGKEFRSYSEMFDNFWNYMERIGSKPHRHLDRRRMHILYRHPDIIELGNKIIIKR